MADTGTLTVTPPDNVDRFNRPVQKWTLAWVSDSSGNVTRSVGHKINGTLRGVVTTPSGTVAPTAAYDVVLKDEHGIDVLAGLGADRSATVAERVKPQVTQAGSVVVYPHEIDVFGDMQLVITNAGNAKAGTITLYVR